MKKLRLIAYLFLLLITPLTITQSVFAQYATGGSGLYKPNIYWFSWGTNGSVINSGTSRSFTITSGTSTFTTTCTLNNFSVTSGTLGFNAYRSGDWSGDGLDDLYNIGGTGTSNTLVSGIRNVNNLGGTIETLRYSCSATLNGSPYTLRGIVMGDAEQSGPGGALGNEYVQSASVSGGTWRIIDRFRTSGCTNSSVGLLTGSTLRLTGPNSICTSGPMAVAYLDGGTAADTTLNGSGISAFALGVFVNTDYGDAPSTYGTPVHLSQPTWSGGTLTAGVNTNVNDAAFTLATMSNAPTPRLGATVDFESANQPNATATGDDSTTAPGTDDENGVTVPASIAQGATVSVPVVVNGNGRLNVWFDWNRDGDFLDSGEQITNDQSVATGTTNLSVIAPSTATTGTSYARFRICSNTAECNTPTLIASSGEAEDYSFTIAGNPDLTIAKSHTGNFTLGSTGTYSFTVSNTGAAATSGTITVTDTLPSGLTVNGGAAGGITEGGTNAANWTCNSNSATPQVITCTSSTAIAAVGTSVFNFAVNVGASTPTGTNSITNTVSVSGGGEINTSNNSASDPTTVVAPIGCSTVYASAFSGGRTSLYTLSGSTMTAIYTAPQNVGGLAISSNGSAYYDNGTFTNPPLYQFNGTNQITTALTMPNLLVGQAADAAGNVYYIDTAYHLRRATVGGSGTATDLGALIFDAGDTIGPNIKYGDMTFDGNGRLLWYSSLNNGAGKTYLYVIDLNSLKAKNIGDIGPDGATGVAFDGTGKLITTSNNGATVYSINLGTSNLDGSVIGTASPTVYDLGSCATPILNPNLTIAKSVVNVTKNQTPATIAQSGDVLEYTVTVTNSGNMPSYDAMVSDSIPTGTTYLANSTTLNGVAIADNAGVMPYATPREVHSGTQPNGVIYGGGGMVTVKFSVTVNSSGLPASILNTATATFPTVSGGITTTNSVNSNTTSTPSALIPPNLVLVKTCPSPVNCTTAPQMPGTDITYKIDFTNNGGSGASNLALVDAIPANMDFKVGSATSNVGTTGLVFAIEYSSDYDALNPTFATWAYVPVSGGGDASVGYDRLVKAIRWRVTSGSLSNISPNNSGAISFISKIR